MLRLFLRLYVLLMLPATAAFVFFMYVTDQVMAQMELRRTIKERAESDARAARALEASTYVGAWDWDILADRARRSSASIRASSTRGSTGFTT